MASLISRARARKHEAITALAAVATFAGLAATPATTSAAARHSSAANATRPAVGRTGAVRAELALLEQRARLDGRVPHASSITGTVLGAHGLPVAGACVTAVGSTGRVTTSATRSGAFTIGGLAAGS
jgi:hypothetical protein